MKNWSDYDIEFPVDFPVATKNRSGFKDTVSLLADGLLILMIVVCVAFIAVVVIATLGAGVALLVASFIQYPLWTTVGTTGMIVLYGCCVWAAKKGFGL